MGLLDIMSFPPCAIEFEGTVPWNSPTSLYFIIPLPSSLPLNVLFECSEHWKGFPQWDQGGETPSQGFPLRQGFLLRQGFGGQAGGQAGRQAAGRPYTTEADGRGWNPSPTQTRKEKGRCGCTGLNAQRQSEEPAIISEQRSATSDPKIEGTERRFAFPCDLYRARSVSPWSRSSSCQCDR